jgi:TPP-dependent pyruvate/acetoin dehydrogenase alpha subunit
MHLTNRDHIASTHRGHGRCIAKGCDVDAMMKELFARDGGLCGGKDGSIPRGLAANCKVMFGRHST